MAYKGCNSAAPPRSVCVCFCFLAVLEIIDLNWKCLTFGEKLKEMSVLRAAKEAVKTGGGERVVIQISRKLHVNQMPGVILLHESLLTKHRGQQVGILTLFPQRRIEILFTQQKIYQVEQVQPSRASLMCNKIHITQLQNTSIIDWSID